MDTGLADILGNPKQIAQPALVIFDLNTNKLIKRYTIPPEHIKDDTFFANVVCVIDFSLCYPTELFAHALIFQQQPKQQRHQL